MKLDYRFSATLLGSMFLAASAFAYIPPSLFIIKTMASKRQGVKSVRIVSQVNGYDSGKPTGVHFKSITIYNPVTHTMKSQAFDDTGIELYGAEKSGESIPLSLAVLYSPNGNLICNALSRAEIPACSPAAATSSTDDAAVPARTVLRRWNGSVAWALGADVTKKESAQFWVEKDTFLPLRLLSGDQDIQFSKYRYSQELPYPRSSSLASRAGAMSLEEDVTEVQVNPSSAAEHSPVAAGFTDAGKSSPAKELIQKFYAGLR